MLRIVARLIGASVIVVAAACGGGGGSPTGPGGGGSGGGGAASRGTLTAMIDGVPYTGTVNSATNTNNIMNVASNSADLTRSISFAVNPAAVGTINVPTSAVQMSVIFTNGSTVTGNWIASFGLGTGTLTISTLTASGASGTFSFTAPPANAASTGTKVVTNGVFSVTF